MIWVRKILIGETTGLGHEPKANAARRFVKKPHHTIFYRTSNRKMIVNGDFEVRYTMKIMKRA